MGGLPIKGGGGIEMTVVWMTIDVAEGVVAVYDVRGVAAVVGTTATRTASVVRPRRTRASDLTRRKGIGSMTVDADADHVVVDSTSNRRRNSLLRRRHVPPLRV